MLDGVTLSVSVHRDARELYEMIWRPEAFPRWASGLRAASIEKDGDGWAAQGPEGPIRLRFSDHNSFGVMDHWIDLGGGRIVSVPLRIVANQDGSEVLLTLFQQPGMTAEQFAADQAWVRRDLSALKALAESERGAREASGEARAMGKPLAGVKVLELARILAGPWIGQLLADLGADVVKVEHPRGDDTRQWGPPFVEGAGSEPAAAAYYHATNRGKRSIVADFETEAGRDRVRGLARHADIVIENFKVGGLTRYGLDPDSLRALNPRLVTCSITGFGQTGPAARRAGYDFLIQAMGGIMHLTGEPDGPPQKSGVAFADIFTGLYGVVGILAALRRAEATGVGAAVDMALLDTQVAVLANQAMNYLVSGTPPRRLGNQHPNIVPYQTFECRDGAIVIAVGNDGQFRRFAAAIGVPALAEDARFGTNPGRVRHRSALVPLLAERLAGLARADLLSRLDREGVPSGPINNLEDVFADPQVVARGMRIDLPPPGPGGTPVPGVASPIVIDGVRMHAERASPGLGQQTAEVLADPAWGGTGVADRHP